MRTVTLPIVTRVIYPGPRAVLLSDSLYFCQVIEARGSTAMWRRFAQAILLTLFAIATLHPAAPPAMAKEFTIEGTVDCGKPTGKLCIPVGRKVGVLTESVSGNRERVMV